DWLATWIVALADGLVASIVMPRSVSERTCPRSITRLPVHDDVHQSVPASPSIAFDAGALDFADVALACPDSPQLITGTPGRPSAAPWAAARVAPCAATVPAALAVSARADRTSAVPACAVPACAVPAGADLASAGPAR